MTRTCASNLWLEGSEWTCAAARWGQPGGRNVRRVRSLVRKSMRQCVPEGLALPTVVTYLRADLYIKVKVMFSLTLVKLKPIFVFIPYFLKTLIWHKVCSNEWAVLFEACWLFCQLSFLWQTSMNVKFSQAFVLMGHVGTQLAASDAGVMEGLPWIRRNATAQVCWQWNPGRIFGLLIVICNWYPWYHLLSWPKYCHTFIYNKMKGNNNNIIVIK